MVLGSLSTDLWFLHTKDSAQSYYSNELNKEDWVRPESENTQKNDWLGPRELSPHAHIQLEIIFSYSFSQVKVIYHTLELVVQLS